MQRKNQIIRFFLAAVVLLLIIGAAVYIVQQDLPYRAPDVLLLVGLFPVLIALRNVGLQATYYRTLIDPINLAILLGGGSFTGMLLSAIDSSTTQALLAALTLLPAYGFLIWLVHRIAAATGGFGLFNVALALFFLPLIANDSSLAGWNVLAPTWVDLVLTGPTPRSLALIIAYLVSLLWGLPPLLHTVDKTVE